MLSFFILLLLNTASYPNDFDPYDINIDANVEQDDVDIRQEELDLYKEYESVSKRGFINDGFVVFPYYTSVDGQSDALGLDTMYYFRRRAEPPNSKPSYLRGFIAVGENSYADIGLAFNNYWKKERHNLYAFVDHERSTGYYYQTSTTERTDPLGTFKSNSSFLELMYRQKLSAYSYLGAILLLHDYNVALGSGVYPSSSISTGVGIIWGTLEPGSIFSSNRSFDFELKSVFYTKFMGSDNDFFVQTISLKKELKISEYHSIFLKSLDRFTAGSVPYIELCSIADVAQAYSKYQYRDRNMLSFGGEYSLALISTVMLKGLLGIIYHSQSIAKFKLNEYLPYYGFGLSFTVNRAIGINGGVQYLAGRDTKGIFFGIGAFY